MKTGGGFDNNLMLINSTSAVTSTVTGSAVDFNGPDLYEINIRACVPKASGTSPKMVLKIQESDDKSNWTDLYVFPDIEAAGEWNKKMRGTKRWRRAVATITGTSPDFGYVMVGASTGGVL